MKTVGLDDEPSPRVEGADNGLHDGRLEEKLGVCYAIEVPLRALRRWIVGCDLIDGFELVMRQCVAVKLLSCLTGKAGVRHICLHRHVWHEPQHQSSMLGRVRGNPMSIS